MWARKQLETNGIFVPKFWGFRTRPEVKSRNAENTLGLYVPIWPLTIDHTPRLNESFRGVAVGPNAAVVHRNIVCRRRSKDLPECRAWKVAGGNFFGDSAADHDGVPVPFLEGWNGCRTFLGRQDHHRLRSNERMVYREEDELAPVQVFEQVLQPKCDRSKHVQPRPGEPKGADRRGNISVDIGRQGGDKGLQPTSEHGVGTGLQESSAVRKAGEGLGAPESASRAPGENQPRRSRTQEFGG